MPAKGPTSTYWIFTINNPTVPNQPSVWPDVRYVVWQLEKGADGTRHLQGYVVFTKQKYLSALKKINKSAHWEVRRGTHEEARDYCMKDDTRVEGPWSKGEETGLTGKVPGKRNDLDTVKADIDAGMTEAELVQVHFAQCAKHLTFFKEYRRIITPARNFKTKVIAIWGPTGTGKSRYCADTYPDAYWKPKSEWWDGYDHQKTIIIDEFYGWLSYDFMLRLLDRYPLITGVKREHVQMVADLIVITSNVHPKDWYRSEKTPWAPLERRIDEIHDFTNFKEGYSFPEKGVGKLYDKSKDVFIPSVIDLYCDPMTDQISPIREKDHPKEKEKQKGKEKEVLPQASTSTTRKRKESWDTDSDEEERPAILRKKKQVGFARTGPNALKFTSPISPMKFPPLVSMVHPDHCHQSIDLTDDDITANEFDLGMERAFKEWKRKKNEKELPDLFKKL